MKTINSAAYSKFILRKFKDEFLIISFKNRRIKIGLKLSNQDFFKLTNIMNRSHKSLTKKQKQILKEERFDGFFINLYQSKAMAPRKTLKADAEMAFNWCLDSYDASHLKSEEDFKKLIRVFGQFADRRLDMLFLYFGHNHQFTVNLGRLKLEKEGSAFILIKNFQISESKYFDESLNKILTAINSSILPKLANKDQGVSANIFGINGLKSELKKLEVKGLLKIK
jgi:hypothetical protein